MVIEGRRGLRHQPPRTSDTWQSLVMSGLLHHREIARCLRHTRDPLGPEVQLPPRDRLLRSG